VNELCDYLLEDVGDAEMVGITIHNEVNQRHKPIGSSFRRNDQLSSDVIWSVFDNVSHSNARFKMLDTLNVMDHSVTRPVGFGGVGIKRMSRPLATMFQLKRISWRWEPKRTV